MEKGVLIPLLSTFISILLSYGISKTLSLPAWVIPACAFNNTTSLPLLLLQSLESLEIGRAHV